MATQNKYSPGEVVYLRESAALGFLESVRISGAHIGVNGWLYTVSANSAPLTSGAHFDRRSQISTQTLYYSEDEFLILCDALLLVEINAKAVYDKAKAQRQLYCPDNPTVG